MTASVEGSSSFSVSSTAKARQHHQKKKRKRPLPVFDITKLKVAVPAEVYRQRVRAQKEARERREATGEPEEVPVQEQQRPGLPVITPQQDTEQAVLERPSSAAPAAAADGRPRGERQRQQQRAEKTDESDRRCDVVDLTLVVDLHDDDDANEEPEPVQQATPQPDHLRGGRKHDASSSVERRVLLPTENDVLLGRGCQNYPNSGNQRLREFAKQMAGEYAAASSSNEEKTWIASRVVHRVQSLTPPGRFIEKIFDTTGEQDTAEWIEVSEEVALAKVRQHLQHFSLPLVHNIRTHYPAMHEAPLQPPPAGCIYPQPPMAIKDITDPSDTDVLCGRSSAAVRHPGNQMYRRLVNENKDLYITSAKTYKINVSRSIVGAIREQRGRFLEIDNDKNTWYDIGDKKAIEKTSQALREGQPKFRQAMYATRPPEPRVGGIYPQPPSSLPHPGARPPFPTTLQQQISPPAPSAHLSVPPARRSLEQLPPATSHPAVHSVRSPPPPMTLMARAEVEANLPGPSGPTSLLADANAPKSVLILHEHDVLSGPGVVDYPGNLRFRALVESRVISSSFATAENKAIAEDIIRRLKLLSPPARFLKRVVEEVPKEQGLQGPWEVMSEQEIIKKTCRAIQQCNRQARSLYAVMPRTAETEEAVPPPMTLLARAEAEANLSCPTRLTSPLADVDAPKPVTVVHEHDVLSGYGLVISRHPGNDRFRSLVQGHVNSRSRYSYEARAVGIIRHLKVLNPPARFLKRVGAQGLQGPLWEMMSEREILEKTCQALRDCSRQGRSGCPVGPVGMPLKEEAEDALVVVAAEEELSSPPRHVDDDDSNLMTATHPTTTSPSSLTLWGFGNDTSRRQPSWDGYFEMLQEFKRQHGNINVPEHYPQCPQLGRWVAEQNMDLRNWLVGKSSTMTQEKAEKLHTLELSLDMNKQQDEQQYYSTAGLFDDVDELAEADDRGHDPRQMMYYVGAAKRQRTNKNNSDENDSVDDVKAGEGRNSDHLSTDEIVGPVDDDHIEASCGALQDELEQGNVSTTTTATATPLEQETPPKSQPARLQKVKVYSDEEFRGADLCTLKYRTLELNCMARSLPTIGGIEALRQELKDELERRAATLQTTVPAPVEHSVPESKPVPKRVYSDDELKGLDLRSLDYMTLQLNCACRGLRADGKMDVLHQNLHDKLESSGCDAADERDGSDAAPVIDGDHVETASITKTTLKVSALASSTGTDGVTDDRDHTPSTGNRLRTEEKATSSDRRPAIVQASSVDRDNHDEKEHRLPSGQPPHLRIRKQQLTDEEMSDEVDVNAVNKPENVDSDKDGPSSNSNGPLSDNDSELRGYDDGVISPWCYDVELPVTSTGSLMMKVGEKKQ